MWHSVPQSGDSWFLQNIHTFLPEYTVSNSTRQFSLQRKARSEPGGTRWRTGGEVKGKLTNGGGSQYYHAISEHGVSSITQADAHTSAASSRLNWRPHRFKWTRPFRGKTKSVSARVPSRSARAIRMTGAIPLLPTSIFRHGQGISACSSARYMIYAVTLTCFYGGIKAKQV